MRGLELVVVEHAKTGTGLWGEGLDEVAGVWAYGPWAGPERLAVI